MSAIIANLSPNRINAEFFEELANDASDIKWVDSSQSIEQQAQELEGITAVIVTPSEYPVELAKLTPSVKLVQTVSAGTDQIDKITLGELGIRVSNNGGGNAVAVAEHTFALIVGVYRKMQLQFKYVKEGEWAGDIRPNWFPQAHEIAGKRVGIVGLGRIGSRIAKRLQGWECETVYTDIVAPDAGLEEELHLTRLSLEDLLRTSDIVSLHVPLNKDTFHMISDREFDSMKSTGILINACRGPVVDQSALVRAIEQEKIAGAALDVTEVEPTPKDNPLLAFDNVIITPHLAAFSQEASEKSRLFAIQNAYKVALGNEPDSVVLPD